MKAPSALQLQLRVSHRLKAALIVSCLGSGLLLICLPLPLWAPMWGRAIAILVLALYGLWLWRRIAMHTARAIVGLTLQIDRTALLRTSDGTTQESQILERSFVAPQLAILQYRKPGDWFARSLLILPDMLERDEYRKLCIMLRMGRPRGSLPI